MLLHMGFHCFCHYLLKRLSFFHLCNFVKNQLSIPWQFWILLQRTWEWDNDFVSFRNTLSSRISESCGRFLPPLPIFFPQAISILLSVVAVPVYISTKSVPFPGHSCQHLLSLVCLIIILGEVKQCLIVILIYIFLMISDA